MSGRSHRGRRPASGRYATDGGHEQAIGNKVRVVRFGGPPNSVNA